METVKIKLFGLKKKYAFVPLGEESKVGDIFIRCDSLMDGEFITRDYDTLGVAEKQTIDGIRNKAMEIIKANTKGMHFFQEHQGYPTTRLPYRIYLRVTN